AVLGQDRRVIRAELADAGAVAATVLIEIGAIPVALLADRRKVAPARLARDRSVVVAVLLDPDPVPETGLRTAPGIRVDVLLDEDVVRHGRDRRKAHQGGDGAGDKELAGHSSSPGFGWCLLTVSFYATAFEPRLKRAFSYRSPRTGVASAGKRSTFGYFSPVRKAV